MIWSKSFNFMIRKNRCLQNIDTEPEKRESRLDDDYIKD